LKLAAPAETGNKYSSATTQIRSIRLVRIGESESLTKELHAPPVR
jgi:hypothetical protein